MDIEQIPQKMAYDPKRLPNLKEVTTVWMSNLSKQFPIALTLTLKQVIHEKRPNGTVFYRIKKADCQRIAQRFIQKLNRETYGKSAERHDLGLEYIVSLEGNGETKNFHFHMMIGDIPKHIRLKDMVQHIKNAKLRVPEINEEHKVKLAYDSGWSEYSSKQVTKRDTDAILWQVT